MQPWMPYFFLLFFNISRLKIWKKKINEKFNRFNCSFFNYIFTIHLLSSMFWGSLKHPSTIFAMTWLPHTPPASLLQLKKNHICTPLRPRKKTSCILNNEFIMRTKIEAESLQNNRKCTDWTVTRNSQPRFIKKGKLSPGKGYTFLYINVITRRI